MTTTAPVETRVPPPLRCSLFVLSGAPCRWRSGPRCCSRRVRVSEHRGGHQPRRPVRGHGTGVPRRGRRRNRRRQDLCLRGLFRRLGLGFCGGGWSAHEFSGVWGPPCMLKLPSCLSVASASQSKTKKWENKQSQRRRSTGATASSAAEEEETPSKKKRRGGAKGASRKLAAQLENPGAGDDEVTDPMVPATTSISRRNAATMAKA